MNPDGFKPTHLSPQKLELFLKSKVWEPLKLIEYGGNLGDPIMHNDLGGLISLARSVRPEASHLIHTSGANRSLSWWEEIMSSLTPKDSVTFSVDGLSDTNHLYRVNAKWQTIEDAMKFCVGKVHTHWKMIVFKHNEHQVKDVAKRAIERGVNWFMLTKSSRYEAGEDPLKPSPHWVSHVVESSSPLSLEPKCVKSSRHYISADGKYFPCCWIAMSESPTIDCNINEDFDFEKSLSGPMQNFVKNWESSTHPTCSKICGSSTSLSSRTQYDQIEIDLSKPLVEIEEKIHQFSSAAG